MDSTNSTVLCVDDDPALLAGFTRTLGRRCLLHTARSGPEGLAKVAADGPYAVVVSDMAMPGMNGVEFLRRVQAVAPNTVRIMLTGHGDHETASEAINEGRIFRFLLKPCDPDRLAEAVEAAIDHHRFIMAEQTLVENLLAGCDEAHQQASFDQYQATRWPKR